MKTVDDKAERRWICLADTASLIRDVGFLVLVSGVPWYVHHVGEREAALVAQYEARQAAFDWYAEIALNALNQRTMVVGRETLVQCQSTTVVAPEGLHEADWGERTWAEHDYPALFERSSAAAAPTPRLSRTEEAGPRADKNAS